MELAAAVAAEHGAGDVRALRARAAPAPNLVQLGNFGEADSECRALIEAAVAVDLHLDRLQAEARPERTSHDRTSDSALTC